MKYIPVYYTSNIQYGYICFNKYGKADSHHIRTDYNLLMARYLKKHFITTFSTRIHDQFSIKKIPK